MTSSTSGSFGPIRLAPGVTRRHVLAYLFAAGISIGMFTYLMSLTPYILKVNLGIPENQHGRVIGNLQFLQEIIVMGCIGWWGAMSDRYGRRAQNLTRFAAGSTVRALFPVRTADARAGQREEKPHNVKNSFQAPFKGAASGLTLRGG